MLLEKECEDWNGTGYVTCETCKGDGRVFWPGVSGKNYPCSECHSKGKVECENCRGKGYV